MRASRYDAQTGLLNRSTLKYNLKEILSTSNPKISLLLIEIDQFSLINSDIGSEASDILLLMLVERLRILFPESINHLGRYETNVFAYFLSYDSVDELIKICRKILNVFNEPFFINQEYIYLSANIGITTNLESVSEPNSLFKDANIALDKSLKSGKNNFCFFTVEASDDVHQKLILNSALHQAIINHEFCLYYQPKVNLISGKITGAEALLRWQHPVKGLLLPANFIKLAEETGLIIQLDEWVLREVFSVIKTIWPMKPNGKGLLAVNIAPQHFNPKYDIFNFINKLILEFNVNPKLIEIEITESALLEESRHNLMVLDKLVGIGFNLTLDDFGTGFNSLNYLLRVPASKIKIDRSFIMGLPNSKQCIAIVRSIIRLCHILDKTVVAEGVETREQMEFLRNEGCDEIQGYYFSRPLTIDDFKQLLVSQARLGVKSR